MRLWRQKIFPILAAFLAAIYLAYLIDYIYPSKWGERICSFAITSTVSFECIWLKKKYLPSVCLRYKALALALAAVFLVVFQQELVPQKKQIEIEMFASGQNQNASSGEVWLCEIKIDGEEQPLSEVTDYETSGWEYISESDDLVFYPDENAEENRLILSIEASEVILCFAQNPWSGIIEISLPNGKRSADLYAAEATWERAEFEIKAREFLSPEDWGLCMVYVMGAFVVLGFILIICTQLLAIDKRMTRLLKSSLVPGDNWWIFFFVILVWRIILKKTFGPYSITPDSASYIEYPWNDFFDLNITTGRTPIYPAFLAILRIILGESSYLSAVPVFQAGISMASLFYMRKALLLVGCNNRVANIVTTFYGANPGIIVWDNYVLTESLALSLTIFFIYQILKFINHPALNTGVATTVLTLFMIFERPTFLLFGGLLFAFWIIRMLKSKDASTRKLFLRLSITSICSFLLVLSYASSFKNNFGYLSLSNVLPRQNLYSAIERGYYRDSDNQEFVIAIDVAVDKSDNLWNAMMDVLDTFGPIESNKFALNVLFENPLRYAKDTLYHMVYDGQYSFGGGNIYTSLHSLSRHENMLFALICAICNALDLKIVWLYVFLLMEMIWLILSIYRGQERLIWIHLGLAVFMLAIPVSTYIATCAEYDRTMIHVVPFVYISVAISLNLFCTDQICVDQTKFLSKCNGERR